VLLGTFIWASLGALGLESIIRMFLAFFVLYVYIKFNSATMEKSITSWNSVANLLMIWASIEILCTIIAFIMPSTASNVIIMLLNKIQEANSGYSGYSSSEYRRMNAEIASAVHTASALSTLAPLLINLIIIGVFWNWANSFAKLLTQAKASGAYVGN